MDELFAPWRMEWVTRPPTEREFDDCVFCELPDVGDDEEHRILARGSGAYAVLNNAPYNPGHTMVVPFAHRRDLVDFESDALLELVVLLRRTVAALEAALQPEGFNLGANIGAAAGASVPDHLHLHVVPRWHSDTSFLPTTANTKVIVEALDESYDRIRDAFAASEHPDEEWVDAFDVPPAETE